MCVPLFTCPPNDPLTSAVTESVCGFVAVCMTVSRLWIRRGRYWWDDAWAFFSMLKCVPLSSSNPCLFHSTHARDYAAIVVRHHSSPTRDCSPHLCLVAGRRIKIDRAVTLTNAGC